MTQGSKGGAEWAMGTQVSNGSSRMSLMQYDLAQTKTLRPGISQLAVKRLLLLDLMQRCRRWRKTVLASVSFAPTLDHDSASSQLREVWSAARLQLLQAESRSRGTIILSLRPFRCQSYSIFPPS